MGILYLVATPIGNLADMTLRGIEILKTVDKIAAEDTRHSQRLLSHYQINTPTLSLHEHNEDARINQLITLLAEDKSIALVSDAGTPLISDPGFRLVRAVREAGFDVVPIPGACAAIAGLVASGLPTDKFIFEGFLPVKKSAMHTHLMSLKDEVRSLIFYESVHRIVNTISIFLEVFGGERVITVARELTKTYETIKQGCLSDVLEWMVSDRNQQKGEFVLVLHGALPSDLSVDILELERVLGVLLKEVTVKQSVKIACELTGLGRKIVYAKALELHG